MLHVAWSARLCVGRTSELCKRLEPIEIPFGGLTHVGPRHYVLDGVQISTGRVTYEGAYSGYYNVPPQERIAYCSSAAAG